MYICIHIHIHIHTHIHIHIHIHIHTYIHTYVSNVAAAQISTRCDACVCVCVCVCRGTLFKAWSPNWDEDAVPQAWRTTPSTEREPKTAAPCGVTISRIASKS